jgi:hypothetical protein
MLPLRRRDGLDCTGTPALAVSGRDGSPLVEFAAGVIQPNYRHYAAVAIIEDDLFIANEECNCNCNCNENNRNVETEANAQWERHVRSCPLLRPSYMF